MMVAARYQPRQYLIGPAIFPIYLYVLRMAILWAFVIYSVVIAGVIPFIAPNATGVFDSLLRMPGVLITVVACVTGVFAAVEFFATHYPGRCPPIDGLFGAWSPNTLPPLEKTPTTGRKPRSFAQAVADIVFGLFFLGWLLLIPRHLFLIMGPGAFYWNVSPFQFANVWMTFFWWAVALSVAQLVWRCVDLVRGTWQQSARAQRMTMQAIRLGPLELLLSVPSHLYVTLKHPAADQLQYGSTLDTINRNIHSGVLFICALVVLQLAFDIGRIALDAYRKRATIQ
jgi:hypothetical protein